MQSPDKDNKELGTKSFIAKCVQNADCAEFPRITNVRGPVKIKKTLIILVDFLDIFKEFNEMDSEGVAFKHGFNYNDFRDELDSIRAEMNRLTFITPPKRQTSLPIHKTARITTKRS